MLSAGVAVTLRHTDILRTSPGWRKEEKRREKLAPASSEKLAGKSQAALGFGASGVLATVLEAQEDEAAHRTMCQHIDSHKHRPPCTARKLLFPVSQPAEPRRANRTASFSLAEFFIQCIIHPPTLAYSCACFLLRSKVVCARALAGRLLGLVLNTAFGA